MHIFDHPDTFFNPAPSQFLHIDINSCFATIEQQYNPKLRNRPIAVAADTAPSCCVIAPSIEAKKLGIKVGCRVGEARRICPDIIILPPDSDKYRHVHHLLKDLLQEYTPLVTPKSIDEFTLDFSNFYHLVDLKKISLEVKHRLKAEIGDYLSVSIGYSTNAQLAKIAAGIIKPDGLVEINKANFLDTYSHLKLTDLTGISSRSQLRLNIAGIYSVLDFYRAPQHQIFSAFRSVAASDWYTLLRGYPTRFVPSHRYSVSHSHVLAKPLSVANLPPLLHKFTHKLCLRLKKIGFQATNVGLYLRFADRSSWGSSHRLSAPSHLKRVIISAISSMLTQAPDKPIRQAALTCFGLVRTPTLQLTLFTDQAHLSDFEDAADRVNAKHGLFTTYSAALLTGQQLAPDRISFGKVEQI